MIYESVGILSDCPDTFGMTIHGNQYRSNLRKHLHDLDFSISESILLFKALKDLVTLSKILLKIFKKNALQDLFELHVYY